MSVSNSLNLHVHSPLKLPLVRFSNQEKLQERFGIHPLAQEVIDQYFSSYAEDLLPLTKEVIEEISRIVQRKSLGKEIAREWKKIIFGKTPYDSSQLIPEEGVLKRALETQSVFERELIHLKSFDCCNRMYERVSAEVRMLDRLWPQAANLSAKELALRSHLIEKARYFDRTFEEQVYQSRSQREELLLKLEAKMKMRPKAQEKIGDVRKVLDATKAVKAARFVDAGHVHQSIGDHFVYTVGRPILDRDAKFIMIRNDQGIPESELPAKMRELHAHGLDRAVLESVPHRALRLSYDGTPALQISYENVHDVITVHRSRKKGEKTRRRVEEGSIQLENRKIKGQVLKNLLSDGWSKHVKATAVDGKQAIAVNRQMISDMLEGQIPLYSNHACRCLAEYFDAVATNDVALMKKGYGQYEPFKQALRLHQVMYQDQRKYFEEFEDVTRLENALGARYEWSKDLRKARCLTEDFFVVWSNWFEKFVPFFQEMNQLKRQTLRNEIGVDALNHLVGLHKVLERLVRRMPPEIREVVKQWNEMEIYHKKIRDNHQISQADKNTAAKERLEEIDRMWNKWMQSKTPEEVDDILGEALDLMQDVLRLARPHLMGLIPFTTVENQERINKILDLEIDSLYKGVIPQILSLPPKIHFLLEEFEKGVESSPLTLKLAETKAVQTQLVNAIEFERSLGPNIA